ncbi:MAG: aspartate kinase [Clostridia bacterium]|nr:aspartate kinase [Clostridia bacterium]
MKKIIAKFGGVCMANSANIKKVIEIIKKNKNRKIIVVSAPGQIGGEEKITDLLYACCEQTENEVEFDKIFNKIEKRFNEIIDYFNLDNLKKELAEIKLQIKKSKEKNFAVSRGEFFTAKILAEILDAKFVDACELIKFKINDELDFDLTYKLIKKNLGELKNRVVVPGFYGRKSSGEILTFTRGGSDYTASLIASGVNADVYENWKDVDGVMSCDPKITNTHYKIKEITYKELRQLSYMGSKILHPDTVLPADEKNIPIIIKSIFEPKKHGTIINNNISLRHFNQIKAITGKKNQTLITIKKIMEYDEVDFFHKLFQLLNNLNFSSVQFIVNVDYVNLVVNENEFEANEKKFSEELISLNINAISVEKNVALITIVGNNILLKSNLFKRVIYSLNENNIEIKLTKIDALGSNIIFVIDNQKFEKAVIIINNLLFKK